MLSTHNSSDIFVEVLTPLAIMWQILSLHLIQRLQIPVVELCFSLFLLAYTTGPVSIMKIYCAFHSEVDVPH